GILVGRLAGRDDVRRVDEQNSQAGVVVLGQGDGVEVRLVGVGREVGRIQDLFDADHASTSWHHAARDRSETNRDRPSIPRWYHPGRRAPNPVLRKLGTRSAERKTTTSLRTPSSALRVQPGRTTSSVTMFATNERSPAVRKRIFSLRIAPWPLTS